MKKLLRKFKSKILKWRTNQSDGDSMGEEDGNGVSFQDQVREYMMGLEDETFEQPPAQVEKS